MIPNVVQMMQVNTTAVVDGESAETTVVTVVPTADVTISVGSALIAPLFVIVFLLTMIFVVLFKR